MIFLREVICYVQFSIIFIMIKVSKNICFKIIGSHHTLNIIVIVKLSGLRLIQKLLNNFTINLLDLNIRG